MRNQMQRRAIGTAVVRRDAKEKDVFRLLRDVDDDVEVAAVVEDAGVNQLEFGILRSASPVFLDELRVRKSALRIFVDHALVGMAWQRVDVEVTLLDVFAVIAFVRHDAEIALLENRIAFVPERERPAEDLIAIAEACDAVLAPAVGLRSREVVRQKAPGVAAAAVILADRRPRAVGEVRTPYVPAGLLMSVASQAR